MSLQTTASEVLKTCCLSYCACWFDKSLSIPSAKRLILLLFWHCQYGFHITFRLILKLKRSEFLKLLTDKSTYYWLGPEPPSFAPQLRWCSHPRQKTANASHHPPANCLLQQQSNRIQRFAGLKGNSGLARLYITKYTTNSKAFAKKTNSLRFIVLMESAKNCMNRKSDDVSLYFTSRS